MHRLAISRRLPTVLSTFKPTPCARFVSHSLPNAPLELDPDLRSLLQDGEITLVKHKQNLDSRPPPRELEELLELKEYVTLSPPVVNELEDDDSFTAFERKSPAAAFGSDSIGQVVLPEELQESIRVLISESDKLQLRGDAKRLFEEEQDGHGWDHEFSGKYRSRTQRDKRGVRDGTAFASVALPAHYSAITSVLSHLKHRLGKQWHVSRVFDWGAGAGSGLWASLHAFQKLTQEPSDNEDVSAANTTVTSYMGFEKRDGLTSIAKRLIENANFTEALPAKWFRGWPVDHEIAAQASGESLALSAFALSSLLTEVARKKLLKEIWDSGAETIVLIDHGTTAGFESIARAREDLLKMGRRELEDDEQETLSTSPRGAHVVAPCPHDGNCPLFRPDSPTKLICFFEQRLQSPTFTRLTRHSRHNFEDIGYSYVAIRRGPRPAASEQKVGRVGQVGRRALARELEKKGPPRELSLHEGEKELRLAPTHDAEDTAPALRALEQEEDVSERLRAEAYHWPRLVFPPLKKGGHIIIDSCTPEGHIMRLTVPRSQGKQEFYDARKSSWGDIFPHPPKNRPQVRVLGSRPGKDGASPIIKGQDIGKRKLRRKDADKTSYEKLGATIKNVQEGMKRKDLRRYAKRKQDKEFLEHDID